MKENKKIPANKDYKTIISSIFETEKEKQEIETQEKNIPVDEVKKKWDMNDKIVTLFVENIGKDQDLRSKYAKKLMTILIVELIALIVIFILKGTGTLNYSDATFNIFVTGGIAEVFVLVRVIVKYLFKDNLTEALKIIITTNNNRKIYKNRKNNTNKKN